VREEDLSYKRIVSARGMPHGREVTRMMQRLGMGMKEVEGVKQVIIKASDKQIILDEPTVTTITMQGQTIYQVLGGKMKEEAVGEKAVPEEDVKLVADQTGKSLEEARRALEQTGGDLAQAILLLKEAAK